MLDDLVHWHWIMAFEFDLENDVTLFPFASDTISRLCLMD
jgi:hypothetical protein